MPSPKKVEGGGVCVCVGGGGGGGGEWGYIKGYLSIN